MRVDSRKFLPVGVLVLISTLAVNGATSKEAAIVKDVSFSNTGESLEAKITASEDSKYTYFELQKPHRLVVDFHGIQNTISFREKRIDAAGVGRVRTSLFSDRKRQATRIVFDLVKDVPYRVIEDGGGVVRIVFGDTVRAPMNLTAGPVIVPEPGTFSISSFASPAMELASLLRPVQPALAAPQAPAPAPEAAPVEVPLVASVPTPAPVSVPASLLRFSPAMAAAESSMLQQTQVTVVPQTPSQVPATTPTATPQYTGEIISIDILNYDMKEFFRLISEISGLNVVLDPNVGGNVSLKLTDVPWDQALDVVLKNYGLGGQLQGNILRIATNSTLQSEQNAQVTLREAQDKASPLTTKTFILSYTQSAEVSGILTKLMSPRGTIIQAPAKNALIVQDIPAQFTNLEAMVKFLDTPSKQVEIEARLLQANKSFSRDIGNQIGFLTGNKGGNIVTGVPGQTSPFATSNPAAGTAITGLPLISNFPAAASSGLSFLLKPGGDILLDEIIGAAEASGTAKLISRPKVTTQNNVAAQIQQGTQIPVQTNVNNTISTQFLSFTLNLTVTPQITDAGTILLKVNITNSQPDFARAVNGTPSATTQSAQTTVLIPDGGTAVIGGIIIDTDTINVKQVPGLGKLPLIGNLFKDTQTAKSTAELFFFITPRIKALDAITVLAPGVDLTPVEQPKQR
jgi:type IV pilus secretin PilQ/predicted competence protein